MCWVLCFSRCSRSPSECPFSGNWRGWQSCLIGFNLFILKINISVFKSKKKKKKNMTWVLKGWISCSQICNYLVNDTPSGSDIPPWWSSNQLGENKQKCFHWGHGPCFIPFAWCSHLPRIKKQTKTNTQQVHSQMQISVSLQTLLSKLEQFLLD